MQTSNDTLRIFATVYMRADQVQKGDIISYGDRTEVAIERVSVARCDGAIGLHGNNDTWSVWYQPNHHIRAKRGVLLSAANRRSTR